MPSAAALVLGSLVIAVGALVQGSVGFGLALVSSPLLVLIDPQFVPGPLAVATLALNVLMVRYEGSGATDHRIRYALVGTLPGIVVAAILVANLPQRGLAIAVALLVLAAVALVVAGVDVAPTPSTLATAGAAAGFMGTIAGTNGPPLALVYQHAPGPVLRGTLPRFFLVAGVAQAIALVPAGQLGAEEWWAAAALTPGTIVGFYAARPLRGHVDRRAARPAVLALSAAAALAVLVRELAR